MARQGVYQVRTSVSHAVRIASVRQHVQRLLSNRHFVNAGLEKKSWWILECPETPPLRLIHWSRIAAAGQLPKYGTEAGATSVEELLDEVEETALPSLCIRFSVSLMSTNRRNFGNRKPSLQARTDWESFAMLRNVSSPLGQYGPQNSIQMSLEKTGSLGCRVLYDFCRAGRPKQVDRAKRAN